MLLLLYYTSADVGHWPGKPKVAHGVPATDVLDAHLVFSSLYVFDVRFLRALARNAPCEHRKI